MRALITWFCLQGLLLAAERHEFQRPLMGTLFRIVTYAPSHAIAQEAAEAAFAAAEAINAAASDYRADSELLELSRRPAGEPIVVSSTLFPLIAQARAMAEVSGGAFDPTLGPLTKLWRESRRRKLLPDTVTLTKARESCGYQHLLCDAKNSTITLKRPAMRLDLGGIAKGQAADAMLAIFMKYDLRSTSITAGGDVRVGDPPAGKEGWQVGVRTFDKNHDSQVLTLANCAVSTSGDLQQSIVIDGVSYAHIIDPATGLGLTHPVAATVIAPTAAQSDALATACCVLAPERAIDLIEKQKGCRLFLPTTPP